MQPIPFCSQCTDTWLPNSCSCQTSIQSQLCSTPGHRASVRPVCLLHNSSCSCSQEEPSTAGPDLPQATAKPQHGRWLQKKEALCCFVPRLAGSVENLRLDLAFMLSVFCLCGLLPAFSDIQNVYIWFSRLYLGWVFYCLLREEIICGLPSGSLV